jgi:hypothetical protein
VGAGLWEPFRELPGSEGGTADPARYSEAEGDDFAAVNWPVPVRGAEAAICPH